MKRSPYYPRIVAKQPLWHFTYADQLELLGVGMGLVLEDVLATANDSRMLGYALGSWYPMIRDFVPGVTAQMEELKFGKGTRVFRFPVLEPPAPPPGLLDILPGALTRIFRYVRVIKAASGYTEGKGRLIGVVGSEIAPVEPGSEKGPRLTLTLSQQPTVQAVVIQYIKVGHDGIWIESRVGNGPWEFLTIRTKGPFTDTRPLQVPGQAEGREYRAMFWDDGETHGPWSGVARITVSP